ncbi:hypothetical protein, partial [Cobetia amphilecti]|uniref:hypothetical protein n=1 Tax=Cobetia amphilecti TaxID=1055104 RepID=UPI0036E494D3
GGCAHCNERAAPSAAVLPIVRQKARMWLGRRISRNGVPSAVNNVLPSFKPPTKPLILRCASLPYYGGTEHFEGVLTV